MRKGNIGGFIKGIDIDDMLCDMYDIRKQARLTKFDTYPKDNDGTETTIKDCIDNVIEKLEKGENDANS